MKLICIRGNSNSFTNGKEYKVVKTLNDERYLVVDNNDIETNIPLEGLVWSFKIKEEGELKMNKQDLKNKIKDLENNIQASQNTIEELKKAIVNMEEKAERALFEQNLRLKLRKFAEDNNDKIDWNNNEEKIYLLYDYCDKKIKCDYVFSIRDFSQIYFSSKEIAEKAIEQFQDELIKYFTEQ